MPTNGKKTSKKIIEKKTASKKSALEQALDELNKKTAKEILDFAKQVTKLGRSKL